MDHENGRNDSANAAPRRKLTIARETLRALGSAALRQAAGGAYYTDDCTPGCDTPNCTEGQCSYGCDTPMCTVADGCTIGCTDTECGTVCCCATASC